MFCSIIAFEMSLIIYFSFPLLSSSSRSYMYFSTVLGIIPMFPNTNGEKEKEREENKEENKKRKGKN